MCFAVDLLQAELDVVELYAAQTQSYVRVPASQVLDTIQNFCLLADTAQGLVIRCVIILTAVYTIVAAESTPAVLCTCP